MLESHDQETDQVVAYVVKQETAPAKISALWDSARERGSLFLYRESGLCG